MRTSDLGTALEGLGLVPEARGGSGARRPLGATGAATPGAGWLLEPVRVVGAVNAGRKLGAVMVGVGAGELPKVVLPAGDGAANHPAERGS